MTLLNVDNVSRRFGGLQATRNVCFQVNRGEIVSLIGPNGAGKTTMFNMITGFVTPNEGEITFDGVSVGHLKPHRSEEHTSELQSLMRISYAVFCLKKKTNNTT